MSETGADATILIVDDVPANLAVMVGTLEERGFEVLVAQDGEEGLQRAEFARPDLILLDVLMPGLDGFATCRRLKAAAASRDIPVIFMTALTDIDNKLAGFTAGGVDYVTKPFEMAEVLARVDTQLALSRMRSTLLRQNAELKLAASVFDNTMDGIMVTDAAARILSVNPAFTAITGYSAEEALGGKPSLLRSEHHGPDFYRDLWATLLRDGRWEGEIWNRRKSGEAFLEWLSIGMIAGEDGKPVRYVAVFNDITELRKKDEHIRHLAFHDPLTGLPNRALLLDRLEHSLAFALRDRERLGIMFIDLDRFKHINDSLGHDIGDGVLQQAASRLSRCLRQTDTVARMGGDEFVLLVEHIDEPEAYAGLAKKIITALNAPMSVGGHAIQIGASIGIACCPEDGSDAVTLMKHADAAMYAAKAVGSGSYRFFQAAMTEKAGQRLQLEMELRHAIGNGELELFYQPKVSLHTGAPCGLEALVRWRHPRLGLVLPDDFIAIAEETGIIGELGDWVLEEACRQASAWLAAGLGRIAMAVNVSARQFEEESLPDRIAGLTRQYGISASDLEFELTESAFMAAPEAVSAVCARLRELGVSIAVDDFGTGYSSLAYLRRLPIDVLKIDRSFVMDADRDDGDAQVVKMIVALGQALKLAVVAEGVETPGQAEFLNACGCAIAQGYLYSRPLPAASIEDWLRQQAAAPARSRDGQPPHGLQSPRSCSGPTPPSSPSAPSRHIAYGAS